jgi:hypothetical protein
MTNATQTMLGGTNEIWHGKECPIGWRSLVCVHTYICIVTKTYNRIQIQNMFAKAMQTTTTIRPVLCDASQQVSSHPLQFQI